MARLSFKPDSSFFRKITIGAVGCRAVCVDLTQYGHNVVELERGSTDTKLWKEVKRKRVRIPDLVCVNCGLRVESRAKTASDLSMSHSPTEEARAWDFGMVARDVIAFPVCEAVDELYWSNGQLLSALSYWHERNWVQWRPKTFVNYFSVEAFHTVRPARQSTKGVTEGSETSIAWNATFSSRDGTVEAIGPNGIKVRRASDGHRYTWRIASDQIPAVVVGQAVRDNQVIASAVPPLSGRELGCEGDMSRDYIHQLLSSRERTMRFTGVKLARLRRDAGVRDPIAALGSDQDEDVYIRLEAASYLAAVCDGSASSLFETYLDSTDQQTQLEAVIAIGEAATPEAVGVLAGILDTADTPYFLRSAAAWSLARVRNPDSLSRLVRAFADIDRNIREEALQGIVAVGGPAIPILLSGLRGTDPEIAAGCAESLRQVPELPVEIISEIISDLKSDSASPWTTWLVGQLPRECIASAIADLQHAAPHLHYAVSLLWSFIESWIARRWELHPVPTTEGVPHA